VNGGLVQVTGENVGRDRLSARRHLCQFVGCLIESLGDVVELKAIKFVLQLGLWQLDSMTWSTMRYELALMSSHRIPSSMAMRSPLTSVSYSSMLLEARKWRHTMYFLCTPWGETKTNPAPAPFFISDPSKYII
jgi:hypothetical protein